MGNGGPVTKTIERTITVDRPADRVWNYLSDFRSTNTWDPGTVKTEVISGDGGPGTVYRNVSKFAGRESELTYTVLSVDPGTRIKLRGENKGVTAHDTITVIDNGDGTTTVTYRAEFDFHGIAGLVAPLLGPLLKKLGDDAEKGLREALLRL